MVAGPNTQAPGWSYPEIGVAIALVLSGVVWLLGVAGSEIYPAANLPSFGGIPEASNGEPTSWQVTLTSKSGDEIKVAHELLFPGVPDSQWPHLFSSVLEHGNAVSVQSWLVSQAESTSGLECSTSVAVEQFGPAPERRTFDGSCE